MKAAKGKLVIIGGHEDKGNHLQLSDEALQKKNIFLQQGVLHRIAKELHGPKSRIEVITTASLIPEEVGEMYVGAFRMLNFLNVGVLNIKNFADANNPEVLERLRNTHGVLFSGGDQNRLYKILNTTEAINLIQDRYQHEDKFVIAGTSAGAMCLSQIMIKGSFECHPLAKGSVELGTGLGFIQKVIIDTHFIVRGRFTRLLEAVAAFPDHLGIGIGEDTAILVTGNEKIETIGSGLVVIFDGRKLKGNNFAEIKNGDLIGVENLITNILPQGRSFSMRKGEFY